MVAEPDAWHLPCAYWFWHRIPTASEIRSQLAEMRAAGIMSFQVQARLSMPLEDYLGADYLAAYRLSVEEAAAYDMVVGIYDDYNWQSGHAAGRAVAGHPELAEAHLFWASGEAPNAGGVVRLEVNGITSSSADLGEAGMQWHYLDSTPRWTDWTVVLGVKAPNDYPDDRSGEVVDVTERCSLTRVAEDGCAIEVLIPEGMTGMVTVFVSARCESSRLVNHMDPTAVRRFIEVGYQPIADALGEHLGTTVQYLFFDQPHPNFYLWTQHHGQLGHAMPVSSGFLDHSREHWGDRLAGVLLSLLTGTSSETRSVRCDFYEGYGKWARDSFLGTVREWTLAHGLALSGHEVLPHVGGWRLDTAFRSWDLRVNFGLDFFAVDSYRDLTACDAQDATPQLSPKLADSVARANGRSGTMLEQYYADAVAGTGHYAGHWGLTPGELRDQTIRHHLSGMRQQILHGFYLTDGHDDDPTMFSNPRFDFPPGFNFEPWFTRYHSDIAYETGRLSQFLDELEVEPRVALVYPLRTIWADGQNGPHAALFGRWAEALTESSVAFRIIDERTLGSITVGDPYTAVVLAGASTLYSSETLDALGALADGGVEILVSGATPSGYQSGAQTAIADWAELVGRVGARLSRVEDVTADAVRRLRGPSTVHTADASAIVLVEGSSGDGSGRIAAFNAGREPESMTFDLPADTTAVVRSASSGDVLSVVAGPADPSPLVLLPSEFVLVEVGAHAGPFPAVPTPAAPAAGEVRLLEGDWSVRVASGTPPSKDSTVVISEVDMTRGLEMQGMPAFSGVATYATTLMLDSPCGVRLELGAVIGGAEVFINGRTVGRRGWTPYTFDIEAADTVAGANHLQVEVAGTAANRYYAGTGMRDHPDPCGMLGWPRIRLRTSGSMRS